MLVGRARTVDKEAGEMLALVRHNRIGSREQAAREMGLNMDTVGDIETGKKPVFRESIHKYFAALDCGVDFKDLRSGKVPSVREVLDRYPTSITVERVSEAFFDAPFQHHDLVLMLRNHPGKVLAQDFETRRRQAAGLLVPARMYNEMGAYVDAFRTFDAAGKLFQSCYMSNDELACLTQCLIVAWTRKEPQILGQIPAVFSRTMHVLEQPAEPLKPSYVGNLLAGLACGAFHYLHPVIGELQRVALQLFAIGDYGAESMNWPAIVDPQLATQRRMAHFDSLSNLDSGAKGLIDVVAEFVRRGDHQGPGNSLIALFCVYEDQARQSGSMEALDGILTWMEDNALYLARASKWTREFSALGRGRILLARGRASEGEALITKHLPRIAQLGFAPGQPMAQRYPLFFSPQPTSPTEAKLFASLSTFQTKAAFPISDAQLRKLIVLAKKVFGVR